jgi:uroporphyrinogen-III synthase
MLFDFATQLGVTENLQQALSAVTIASIGEVTSRALGEHKLTPKIVPAQSKMGHLAQAVADYFKTKGS